MKLQAFYILLAFVFFCPTLQAMKLLQRAQKSFALFKTYKRTLGLAIGTTAGFSVCAYSHPHAFKDANDPCPLFTKFAQTECSKAGLNNAKIKITKLVNQNNSIAHFNTIYINDQDYERIVQLLKENPTDQELDKWKYILQHEANHVRNKHSIKMVMQTIGSVTLSGLIMDKLAFHKMRMLSRLMRGPLFAASVFSVWQRANQHERQADAETENKLQILKAASLFFKDNRNNELSRLDHLRNSMMSFKAAIDVHDPSKNRADSFDARLAQLEQKKP